MSFDAVVKPGSQAQIVPATWHDVAALRALEKVCFPQDAWPLWDIVGVLTLPAVIRLKAVVDGRMVGFVAADVRRREDLAWIATIGVLPEYRRRGIGAALLEACESQLTVSQVKLCVRLSNRGAQALYRQFGYAPAGRWRAYYRGGEDALIMEKTLKA
ncbi:MAG TPA: GNAT family N-acetyltransferase [Chloroflexi bacterium]|nr:GNAT family N-acetyltransferase [Chloroflexota bacterium]